MWKNLLKYSNKIFVLCYVTTLLVPDVGLCLHRVLVPVFAPTFRGHEGLVVLRAPSHRVQLGGHDITPEVSLAVVSVAAEAQQQQLAARGDDGGHPVGVRAVFIGHLQLHAGLEAALKTDLHLREKKTNLKI